MMRTKPGNTLGLSVKTYPADLPPLHQETRIQWDVVDSPSNSQWTLENPESETARFTPESEGSYEIAVTVSDSGYETRLSVIVLVDVPDPALASTGGLLGHWSLDELVGGSFPDSSAFNRSMFHRNVSTLIQGVQGKSAFFNGSDRYLRLSPHAAIFRTLPQGTISLWFRTGSDSPQTLFCASHLTSANQFFRVVLQDGRLAAFRQTPSQVNPDGIEGSRRVDDNQWHHLAIVSKASGEFSLYLDGSIEASGTMAFLRGLHEINELTFAVTRLNNSSSDPFNGYLDEIRIFDEPSDLNQVRWLAGQSLTPLGIDVALSDEWVIAPGPISREVFGF
ncbi:MAG: LamG domain-containing protein, partial [Verrucomicrobia bacterium]|nr:LamG domain-containing protein [Verrucomicrobiota bacterium]